MASKKQNTDNFINWTKADKPYPSKYAKLTGPKPIFDHEFTNKNQIIGDDELNKMNKQRLTIKDLCEEDKQKIANLIKELAKMSEEKKLIEQSLEEERKKKEIEYQEILQQQELLLNEKEMLLKKLEKIQLKKLSLKNKLNKKESAQNSPRSVDCATKQKEQEHSSFNPFKSSTPKTQSPRSLSPVKEASVSKGFIDEQHEKDIRRIELIKQQMELINEQKYLKELLTKQEEIFSQKQNNILILQKLHSKRLEEAYRINSADTQLEHFIPEKLIVDQHSNHNEFFQTNQTQTSSSNVCLNDINPCFNPYSNTAYKPPVPNLLLHEKSHERLNYDPRFANLDLNKFQTAHKPSEVDFVSSATDKYEDEILLDLMLSQDEPQKLENNNLKNGNKSHNKVKPNRIENDDLEECKLIEDLFFLK